MTRANQRGRNVNVVQLFPRAGTTAGTTPGERADAECRRVLAAFQELLRRHGRPASLLEATRHEGARIDSWVPRLGTGCMLGRTDLTVEGRPVYRYQGDGNLWLLEPLPGSPVVLAINAAARAAKRLLGVREAAEAIVGSSYEHADASQRLAIDLLEKRLPRISADKAFLGAAYVSECFRETSAHWSMQRRSTATIREACVPGPYRASFELEPRPYGGTRPEWTWSEWLTNR